MFSVGLADLITPPSTVFAAFNHYAGEKQIEIYEFNGQLRQYAEDDDYRRLIDAMVTMLPEDQPLVWVDVYRPDALDASRRFNELLRDRLDTRGNAFVADWFSRASDTQLDILRDDGLHPNTRGNLVFADLVADALARLTD